MICLIQNTEAGYFKVMYCRRDHYWMMQKLQAGNHQKLELVSRYGGDEVALKIAHEALAPWIVARHFTGHWYKSSGAVREWFAAHELRGDKRQAALAGWRVKHRGADVVMTLD